jgi:hypothetical protein
MIMNKVKTEEKKELKKQRRALKRKKKNALVVCHDGTEYWTTQDQFWQWVRERIIVKAGDFPLRGEFIRPNAEKEVVICNTVLNLAHPHHLSEAIYSRRFRAN